MPDLNYPSLPSEGFFGTEQNHQQYSTETKHEVAFGIEQNHQQYSIQTMHDFSSPAVANQYLLPTHRINALSPSAPMPDLNYPSPPSEGFFGTEQNHQQYSIETKHEVAFGIEQNHHQYSTQTIHDFSSPAVANQYLLPTHGINTLSPSAPVPDLNYPYPPSEGFFGTEQNHQQSSTQTMHDFSSSVVANRHPRLRSSVSAKRKPSLPKKKQVPIKDQIYNALKDAPRHARTVKEINDWIADNTKARPCRTTVSYSLNFNLNVFKPVNGEWVLTEAACRNGWESIKQRDAALLADQKACEHYYEKSSRYLPRGPPRKQPR